MKPTRQTNDDAPGKLPPEAFARADDAPDEEFYVAPRFVTHIDDAAIAYVTDLYRELIPAGAAVLDLMSSWVSHLPPEVTYGRAVGLGMNEAELKANPRLTEWAVQDLNADSRLALGDAEFDAALICVSIQYLTAPIDVLREVGRVLRPNAPVIITFSNRCFPTKAVAVWRVLDDAGHVRLVEHYLRQTGMFDEVEQRAKLAKFNQDPLYAVIGRKAP